MEAFVHSAARRSFIHCDAGTSSYSRMLGEREEVTGRGRAAKGLILNFAELLPKALMFNLPSELAMTSLGCVQPSLWAHRTIVKTLRKYISFKSCHPPPKHRVNLNSPTITSTQTTANTKHTRAQYHHYVLPTAKATATATATAVNFPIGFFRQLVFLLIPQRGSSPDNQLYEVDDEQPIRHYRP
jgi:hypothetical protein